MDRTETLTLDEMPPPPYSEQQLQNPQSPAERSPFLEADAQASDTADEVKKTMKREGKKEETSFEAVLNTSSSFLERRKKAILARGEFGCLVQQILEEIERLEVLAEERSQEFLKWQNAYNRCSRSMEKKAGELTQAKKQRPTCVTDVDF